MWVLGTSQHCFYNIMLLWKRVPSREDAERLWCSIFETNVNVSAFFSLERPLVQAIFVQFH